MRRTAARTALVVLTLSALGLASACSGTAEDPGAGPASESSATGPTSPTSPTRPASSAGVEPATGVRLSMPHATVRAPAGWTKADQIVSTETGADDPHTPSILSLGENPAFGGTPSVGELADSAIATSPGRRPPKELAPVTIDGVETYHVAGQIQPLNYLVQFGAVVDDRIVTLSFQFDKRITPAEREQIVDAVLATFRWR